MNDPTRTPLWTDDSGPLVRPPSPPTTRLSVTPPPPADPMTPVDAVDTVEPVEPGAPVEMVTAARRSSHRPRRRAAQRGKNALALLAAAAVGVAGALAIRALQSNSSSTTPPAATATPTTLAADAATSSPTGSGPATTGTAGGPLPSYIVGQCLGLATAAGTAQPVVDCKTAQAFDLVTAVADGTTIACPTPVHGGAVASHTMQFGNAAFSWCAAAPPTKDGFFEIGTCFQHIDANGTVSFIERACDDVLATHQIIGEAPKQDCSAVPGATATISKSKAEGQGYWCAKALH